MAFTYFFRDKQVLDLLAQHVIPELKTRMYMNVWDAGCANGPEPYSIAITFRENMGRFLFRNVRIYATDIDEGGDFGQIIAQGVYTTQEVKRLPADILDKYFEPLRGAEKLSADSGSGLNGLEPRITGSPIRSICSENPLTASAQSFRVKAELRQAVRYQTHDLLSLAPVRDGFGLIVCKNVLLHFTPAQRVAVVKMFHAALSEGGCFVTEQTQKLPPGTDHLFRQVTEAGQVFQKI